MFSPLVAEAKREQERLKQFLIIAPLGKEKVHTVCGVDVSYLRERSEVFATASIFSYPSLDLLEECYSVKETFFPYIPGYLGFREIPAIIHTLKKISSRIDLIFADGHGIAHPRKFGLASHLGVVTRIPTIGIAKKKLVGEYEVPGEKKGDTSPLLVKGIEVGTVLRTRDHTKPLFVSPGHLTDVESSRQFAVSVLGKFRIVEPIRHAHMLTVRVRKKFREEIRPFSPPLP